MSKIGWLVFSLFVAITALAGASEQKRTEAQEEYATVLWDFVHTPNSAYTNWAVAEEAIDFPVGPSCRGNAKMYLNRTAAVDGQARKSLIVTEHFGEDAEGPVAVTIRFRAAEGYNAASEDWYWAHYLADGTVLKTVADKSPYAKRGFVTYDDDGRLWIFRTGSAALADYASSGDLGKRVIRPGAGPGGKTVMSGDNDTIDAYLAAKAGFVTKFVDGRLWVFCEGAEELAEFKESGELGKHVIRPAAGPGGLTVKGPDADTIAAYLAAADGFVTMIEDGRIWVFRPGSPELADFEASGEPAKQVVRPGAGPLGMTVKGADSETIEAYLRVCVR